MAPDQVDTIIGAHVELTGTLRNQGPIHIHGRVNGDVISESSVLIGETAVVMGPVTAKTVEVAGQVHGSITAEHHLELQPKSMVKGDIDTRQLSIRPGAIFVGSSKMEVPATNNESEAATIKRKPRLEIE
jgi:cytoskeletal protein CcmA (bactofilin family)